jgi:hypothetical protein
LDVFPIGSDSGPAPSASFLTGADARGGVGRSVRASYTATGQGQVVAWRSRPNGGSTTWGSYAPASNAVVMSIWFRVSAGGAGAPVGWKWFEWWEPTTGFRNQISPTQFSPNPFSGEFGWVLNMRNVNYNPAVLRPPFSDVNDGAWHRFTVLFQTNTSAGARNGVVRVWVDGTKILDCSASAAGVTPAGATREWCSLDDVDGIPTIGTAWVEFSQYHNDTPSNGAFTEDFDDARAWLVARVT